MGQDKASLDFGGGSLLEFVVGLVPADNTIIVVGEPRDIPAIYVREEPQGGGPVAAIHAALPHISSGNFRVIAVDTPFGVPWLFSHTLHPDHDAVIPRDSHGRPHYLCAQYNAFSFAHVLFLLGTPENASMKEVVSGLKEVEYVDNPHTETLKDYEVLLDINTSEDLIKAHALRVRGWGE
jgi:molybdopterin-guanine dinucleotide biosynthesis protein A